MPVSEATARKAVERWDLDGTVTVEPCGCRKWHPVSVLRPRRIVKTCKIHRRRTIVDV